MTRSAGQWPRRRRSRGRRAGFARLRGSAAGIAFALAALIPGQGHAVTYLEQAERLQEINAYLLDFRPAGAPRLPEKSVFEVQAELIPSPKLDKRVGAKDEPVDPPPATPRVRAKYLAAQGLMAGVTLSPPLEVMGFSAPWVGGELGWRAALGRVHGELRGYLLNAQVTGPITESGAKDEFDVQNQGFDLRFGIALGSLMPYAGAGTGHTKSTLTIESDGAQLEAERDYRYWMIGATYRIDSLLFTFEQESTEGVLYHFILAAGVQF